MAKQISSQQLIGERGRHLFSERILGAGLSFHPTGALDAGIDGFLEMRDPESGEVKAQFVTTQLKTQNNGPLPEETNESFSWIVNERDLSYWLQSNTPVLFVVIRLSDHLIAWKSIQGWFSNAERRASRKIVFDKRQDGLSEQSVAAFAQLISSFGKPGLMTSPMRAEEYLYPNIIKAIFPKYLNVGSVECDRFEFRLLLLEKEDHPPIDWIIYGKRIITFRDLDSPLFKEHVESAEPIDAIEWANSDGEVTRRQFADLLRRCLSERIRSRMTYFRSRGYFFFRRGSRSVERRIDYQSYEKAAKRFVVKGYGRRKSGEGPAYVRHAAFFPRFIQLRSDWFLSIEPTYHFTRDGFEEYPFGAERLSGIKRLETNQSVRGHIGMWRAVLTEGSDLLRTEYPYLRFETVNSLPFPVGVPDEIWRGTEDEERQKNFDEAQRDLFG